MILVLKDADFSANNIGQITIPVEMHAFTERIFNKCDRFGIDSPQALAMNAFIVTLDEQGILEHLGGMICPWLCDELASACYELVNQTQLTADSGLSMPSPGLINSDNVASYPKIDVDITVLNNFFGFITSATNPRTPILRSSGSTQTPAISIQPVLNASCIQKTTNYGSGGYTSASAVNGKKYCLTEIGALSALDENASTFINGASVEKFTGYSSDDEPFSDAITRICPAGYKTTDVKFIIFWGDNTPLTPTQRTALLSAMSTLVDALVANEPS